MAKYEHKVVVWELRTGISVKAWERQTQDMLNSYDKEGYELVSVVTGNSGPGGANFVYHFRKKRKTSATK